ncbi:hypothetical protein ACFL35_12535 [Candidatus Riflebacteria bacterium]
MAGSRAAIGSVFFPPIGTIAGGIAGAWVGGKVAGLIKGIFKGKDDAEPVSIGAGKTEDAVGSDKIQGYDGFSADDIPMGYIAGSSDGSKTDPPPVQPGFENLSEGSKSFSSKSESKAAISEKAIQAASVGSGLGTLVKGGQKEKSATSKFEVQKKMTRTDIKAARYKKLKLQVYKKLRNNWVKAGKPFKNDTIKQLKLQAIKIARERYLKLKNSARYLQWKKDPQQVNSQAKSGTTGV